MNPGGDAAEQVVRLSLEGAEVAARISGNGAKNIALLLYAALKEGAKDQRKGSSDQYAQNRQGAKGIHNH